MNEIPVKFWYAVDKTDEDGNVTTDCMACIVNQNDTLDEFLENKPINYRKLTGEERDKLGI